jgi:predicted small metal-binding protein
MGKVLKCRDVGVDCDFEAHGATEEEVLGQAAAHAKAEHNMEQIPPELLSKAKAAIKDE